MLWEAHHSPQHDRIKRASCSLCVLNGRLGLMSGQPTALAPIHPWYIPEPECVLVPTLI